MLPGQYQYNVNSRNARGALSRMSNTALTTSPQLLPMLNAVARMFGGTDFMSMGATEQQILQTAAGFALDNGLLPGYITNTADTYDDMYQTLLTTGAFRGLNHQEFAEAAYSMHSRMNSFIFGADGSVNYLNTGGMSGTLASQVYTKVLGEELTKGNISAATSKFNLTQGNTGAAGVAAMMRNVHSMVQGGEITYAEGQKYRQAEKAWGNLKIEAAAREKMLRDSGIKNGEPINPEDIMNDDLVRQAREKLEKDGGFDQKKFNDDAAAIARDSGGAYDALALKMLHSNDKDGDPMYSKGVATDQELIGDSGTLNTLRSATGGSMNIQRTGTVSQVSFARREGEGDREYIARLRRAAADGSLSGENYAKLRTGLMQLDALDATHALDGLSGSDLVAELDRMGAGAMSEILKDGDTGKMDQFKMESEELKKRVEERVRKIGETCKTLEEVFGTDDLGELQRYATELGIGSLTDVGNAERLQKSVSNMYDLANYSGRSIESVMLERKSMAKTLASMSGGRQFVSEEELNYMQVLRQQSMADDTNGDLYSADERFAMTKRSHENALEYFGGAGAAAYLLKSNPGLLSQEDQKDFASKISEIKQLMASKNPEDREKAKRLSRELDRKMEEGYGIDERTRRYYFNKGGFEFTKASMKQGAQQQFDYFLNGDGRFSHLSASDKRTLSATFELQAGLFGSDHGGFMRFANDVRGKTGDDLESSLAAYMQRNGIAAGSKEAENLRKLANNLSGMGGEANPLFSVLAHHQMAQGIVGSITESGMREASWKAFRNSGRSSTLSRPDNPMDSFVDAFFNGGQGMTLSGFLEAGMFETLKDGEGGWKNKDNGSALREYMEAHGGAVLSGAMDKDGNVKINDDALATLAERSGVVLTDAEKEAWSAAKSDAERNSILQGFASRTGGRLTMVGGHIVYASEQQLAEANEEEKKYKELMNLDISEAVGEDSAKGVEVTRAELEKMGIKDSDFVGGKYAGQYSMFSGKDWDGILDAMNTKGSDGKTLAQEISENRDNANPVGVIARFVKDLVRDVTDIKDAVVKDSEKGDPGSIDKAASQGGA